MMQMELIERARSMGYQAATRNESRAPAQSRDFMNMMQAEEGAELLKPLQAFADGYQSRCDEEASAILYGKAA